MFGLGLIELLILAVVLLLFFGPYKINDVTKSIGQGIRKFKEAKNEIEITSQDQEKLDSQAKSGKNKDS
ncbi:MAG: twin-arginine translocase TatA/TatE family subunit [Pseudobdellovibrionaceae bacterium]